MNHDADIARLTAEVGHLREAASALASTTVERARCDERDRARSCVLADISKRLDDIAARFDVVDRRLDAIESARARTSTLVDRVTKIENDRRAASVARIGVVGTVVAAMIAAVTAWFTAR